MRDFSTARSSATPSDTRAARGRRNLDDETVDRKLSVFAAYGAHDEVVRRAPDAYLAMPGLGDWLRREHLIDDRDVARTSRASTRRAR